MSNRDVTKQRPKLFSPLTLRGVTLKNRLVLSPMCQYSAGDGIANDWHFAHLARFALGGFAVVMVEATAVTPEGRITPGDLGLWNDAQAVPLARIAAFLKANGSVPAIQLAHAGRKAATQRPWQGDGPLDDTDARQRAEMPWPIVGPSALPHGPTSQIPSELDSAGLQRIRDAFAAAARRADAAGFEVIEVHCAHAYLLNAFLSPFSNKRRDQYGGSLENRMRFPLEIVEVVRAVLPEKKPLFVRFSTDDGLEGGWSLGDSIAFAKAAGARGADVADCSSGGINAAARTDKDYQTRFAGGVKRGAEIATMAVGLIRDPRQAAHIIENGDADLIAIAREALVDPQWPLRAEQSLLRDETDFSSWPIQSGHWLARRAKFLAQIKD